jgi:ankyrin repeat protein
LIAAGAGVDLADRYGQTPLYIASKINLTDIVRALIAAGSGVNITNVRGQTPLDPAIYFDFESITNALIQAGGMTGTGWIGDEE